MADPFRAALCTGGRINIALSDALRLDHQTDVSRGDIGVHATHPPSLMDARGASPRSFPDSAGRTTRANLYYAAALLPMLVLFALHWNFLPRLEATDFALYLMQAESFLRGDGIMASRYIYTDLHPGYGPSVYPPGFPLLLVPILAVFGSSLLALKLLMLFCAIVFVLLAGRYWGERYGLWTGVAVTLITGVALESSYAMQTPQSDLAFCALLWAMFVLADVPQRWSWWRVVAVTLLGFAAMSFRTAGVVLFPAMALFAVVQRREHGVRPFLPALIWGASVVAAMSLVDASLASTGTTLVPHFARYRLPAFIAELYPFPFDAANDAYHAVASILVLIGIGSWLIRSRPRSFLVIFAAAYVAMLGFVAGTDERYLWPVFPVVIFGLVRGTQVLISALRRQWSETRVQQVAVSSLALVALVTVGTSAMRPPPPSLLGMADVRTLFAKVRSLNGDRAARVVFVNPRVLAWQTGAYSMPVFAGSPDKILVELCTHRITHVVTGDIGVLSPLSEQLDRAVRALPQHFVAEYRNPTFVLYRVVDRCNRSGQR